MRTRSTFGMILYGKCGLIFQTDTFNRIIIEVDVCHFNVRGIFNRFWIYTKAVVLSSNLTLAGDRSTYLECACQGGFQKTFSCFWKIGWQYCWTGPKRI